MPPTPRSLPAVALPAPTSRDASPCPRRAESPKGQSLARLGLALFGYLLTVTLIITLLPFQFARPDRWRVLFTGSPLDISANVLLFVPLGFLFRMARVHHRRHSAIRVLWSGALVSMAIECLQLFEAARYTSVSDVGANALGAWLGAALGDRVRHLLKRGEELVGRLSLELPLMGLLYLMVPLLWLNALASGDSREHAALSLLVALSGALVVGGLQQHHFGPDRRVAPWMSAAVTACWYAVGAFPLLGQHGWITGAGMLVAAGAAWGRGRLDAGRINGRERRYEVSVLRSCAPAFLAYGVLLRGGPLLDGVGPWRMGLGFPGGASEWTRVEILRLLELVAASTLGGYAVAEYRGRALQRFRHGAPRLVALSLLGAAAIEWLRGFHADHGASLARGLLVTATGVYGGWLYYLQRRHVLTMLGEVRSRAIV